MTEIEKQIASIMLHHMPDYSKAEKARFAGVYENIDMAQRKAYQARMIERGLLAAEGKRMTVTPGGKKVLLGILKGF